MKPTPGMTVQYLAPGSLPRAAIVVNVLDEQGTVDLVVFADGASEKPEEFARARELWATGNRVVCFRGQVAPHGASSALMGRSWRPVPQGS